MDEKYDVRSPRATNELERPTTPAGEREASAALAALREEIENLARYGDRSGYATRIRNLVDELVLAQGSRGRPTPAPAEEDPFQRPPERDGGTWVGTHLLSELMVATAQARCAGLDFFGNDAGWGWVWIPGDEIHALVAIGDEVLNRHLRDLKGGV